MITETVLSAIETNMTAFLVCLFILFIALTEIFVIWISKDMKRRSCILQYTIGVKFMAMFFAVFATVALTILSFGGLMLIDDLIQYYVQIFRFFGVVGLIAVFIGLNTILTKKYSEEATHTHKFKKGQVLRATENIGGFTSEDGTGFRLNRDYKYKFVKNEDYDRIRVKCVDKNSIWEGEEAILKEHRFE